MTVTIVLTVVGQRRSSSSSYHHRSDSTLLLQVGRVSFHDRYSLSLVRGDLRTIHHDSTLLDSTLLLQMGAFHPNGVDVLLDGAVWDVRSPRLLRVIPALEQTVRSRARRIIIITVTA